MNSTETESSSFETCLESLSKEGVFHKQDVPIKSFSYLETGGDVRILIQPATEKELSKSIAICTESKIAFKVVGATSNLLFLDDANYSVFISTERMVQMRLEGEGEFIYAQCGVMMPDLARFALYNSVAGFEGLEGIPGTIGGGVFMNAGAYGSEIKDELVSVRAVRPDGSFVDYSLNEIGLGHRTSVFRVEKKDEFICSCRFRAPKGNAQAIFSKMELFHSKRHKYQDFMFPNLGSLYSGSPYRIFAEDDKVFRFISALYYLFNYKWRLFRRESPINRRWLNEIVVKRFGIKYELQPFSDKTMNCLVNRGQGSLEMVRFISEMEGRMKGRIPLENEIVEEF